MSKYHGLMVRLNANKNLFASYSKKKVFQYLYFNILGTRILMSMGNTLLRTY